MRRRIKAHFARNRIRKRVFSSNAQIPYFAHEELAGLTSPHPFYQPPNPAEARRDRK